MLFCMLYALTDFRNRLKRKNMRCLLVFITIYLLCSCSIETTNNNYDKLLQERDSLQKLVAHFDSIIQVFEKGIEDANHTLYNFFDEQGVDNQYAIPYTMSSYNRKLKELIDNGYGIQSQDSSDISTRFCGLLTSLLNDRKTQVENLQWYMNHGEVSLDELQWSIQQKQFNGRDLLWRETVVNSSPEDGNYSLVLFMHGGTGLANRMAPLYREHGQRSIRRYFEQTKRNAIIAFPIMPPGVATYQQTDGLLMNMIEHYRDIVDIKHVYVCGTSNGGRAAWKLLADNPNTFDGVMVVDCGMTITPQQCAGTAICFLTGSAIGNQQGVIDNIKQVSDAPLRYQYYPTKNHGTMCQTSFSFDNLSWLFSCEK